MPKSKGIDKPNYTQTPNVLFDELMRDMGEAELKVTLAIVRETFGWHRHNACYEMTISDLEGKTGMTRPSVTKGIAEGMKRGTIRREIDNAGRYYYGLIVGDDTDEDDKEPLLIKRRNNEQAGKNSLPPAVKNFNHDGKEFLPEAVKNIDHHTPALKKEKEITAKKEKEKNHHPRAPEQNLTAPQDDDDDLQAVYAAWVDAMEPELNRYRKKRLAALAEKYGATEVIRMIFHCADAGGQSLSYVITALQNGAAGIEPPTRAGHKPPPTAPRSFRPDAVVDPLTRFDTRPSHPDPESEDT
jgi:hypothetical protein